MPRRRLALRCNECLPSHKSLEAIEEVLKWKFPDHWRGSRKEQPWWSEMMATFPEIEKHVISNRKEYDDDPNRDRPWLIDEKTLKRIGAFIAKRDPRYKRVIMYPYKMTDGEWKPVPCLVMDGINVNPGQSCIDLVYASTQCALVEGQIIGVNTWGDGEIMKDHRVVFRFNPNDLEELAKAFRVAGPRAWELLGWWERPKYCHRCKSYYSEGEFEHDIEHEFTMPKRKK